MIIMMIITPSLERYRSLESTGSIPVWQQSQLAPSHRFNL